MLKPLVYALSALCSIAIGCVVVWVLCAYGCYRAFLDAVMTGEPKEE